jgi:hypothetical protein
VVPAGAYRLPTPGRDGVLVRSGDGLTRLLDVGGDAVVVRTGVGRGGAHGRERLVTEVVGHLAGLGRRATEDEVRAFFAPYEEYAGLAGIYALGRRYL